MQKGSQKDCKRQSYRVFAVKLWFLAMSEQVYPGCLTNVAAKTRETMTTTDKLTWSREGSRDSTLDRKQEMLRAGKTIFPREEHTN